jgi:hypothetical protein
VEENPLGSPVTWGFSVERVTGIEPALSAWESQVFVGKRPATCVFSCRGLTVGALERPSLAGANCTEVARGPPCRLVRHGS